jgi:cytochrome d ubiquinol oxidase subunit I
MFEEKRWLLKVRFYDLPLPWIAKWPGWFVAEYGRQPWTIGIILPTFISVSPLTTEDLIGSLAGFALLYTILLIAEVYLMVKFKRLGPSSLHTRRYYFKQKDAAGTTA